VAWLASRCLARHARLRHDGGHPAPGKQHAALKNEPPEDDAKGIKASPPLIRWSVQKIRRIAIQLSELITGTLSSVFRNVSTILRQPAFEFKLGFSAFGLAG